MENKVIADSKAKRLGARITQAQRQKLELLAATTNMTISDVVGNLIDQAAIKPIIIISGNQKMVQGG